MTSGRATAARAAYLVVILVATLRGLGFDPHSPYVDGNLFRALAPALQMSLAIDAVRNILLFAGLGAVWMATTRTPHPLRVAARVTLIGFVLSAFVETLQLFSYVRNASVIDVATDTAGTLAGALIVMWALRAVASRLGKPAYVGVPAVVLASSYGAAVLMEAFMPLLRQDLLPNFGGGVRTRIAQGLAAFDPQSLFHLPSIDFVIFLPAGALAFAAAVELGLGARAAVPMVALVGTLLVAAIEVLHTVALAPIILGAVVVHALAIAAGAGAAATVLPIFTERFTVRHRARFLAVGYSLVVMVWSWRPFRLELDAASMAEQFSKRHVIPLQALASRGDLFSVTDVIAQGMLFLPLGALLAVWPVRRTGPLRGLLPAFYLSIVLEMGKIVVAERFMDVTHILIQTAGAAIGWLLLHRAGFAVEGELIERVAPEVNPGVSRRA